MEIHIVEVLSQPVLEYWQKADSPSTDPRMLHYIDL